VFACCSQLATEYQVAALVALVATTYLSLRIVQPKSLPVESAAAKAHGQ
jgi:hypothetical protein